MLKLIKMVRDDGKIPMVMNNYTRGDYNNDDYTYDFIMPAADVTVTTTQGPGIYYIDADGKERWLFLSDCQEIYPHIGTLVYKGQEKWFYVKPGVYSFDVDINIIAAQANIILCDGVVATFSRQPQGIYNRELKDGGYEGGGIAIYGQREGNAKIYIQDGQGGKIDALGDIDIYSGEIIVKDFELSYALISYAGNVNIHGGKVTTYNTYASIFARNNVNIYGGIVNATGGERVWTTSAIYAQGNVNIYGGQVTAIGEGGVPGIKAGYNGDHTITLGWTNYSDRITSSSYVCGNINVQDGKTLYDGNALYSGDITSSTDNIKDKTLIPYIANATADDGTGILYDKDAGLPEGHRNADRIAALTSGTSNDLAILVLNELNTFPLKVPGAAFRFGNILHDILVNEFNVVALITVELRIAGPCFVAAAVNGIYRVLLAVSRLRIAERIGKHIAHVIVARSACRLAVHPLVTGGTVAGRLRNNDRCISEIDIAVVFLALSLITVIDFLIPVEHRP